MGWGGAGVEAWGRRGAWFGQFKACECVPAAGRAARHVASQPGRRRRALGRHSQTIRPKIRESKSRTRGAARLSPERRTMSLRPWPGRRAKASSWCRQRCGSARSAGAGCCSSRSHRAVKPCCALSMTPLCLRAHRAWVKWEAMWESWSAVSSGAAPAGVGRAQRARCCATPGSAAARRERARLAPGVAAWGGGGCPLAGAPAPSGRCPCPGSP